MIEAILRFSLQHRALVALLSALVAAIGLFNLRHLPIDAVPDITNNQVQVNSLAPSLSPDEVEKQVTFPIETALAGIPGLQHTRSLSRNGFSQVTAIFDDKTDIYFARQQISERLATIRESLPPQVEPELGAISTGLGEIYIWTVEYTPKPASAPSYAPHGGWQADGSYRTPEGDVLHTPTQQATYLRTVQDWIIQPHIQAVQGVAAVDAIGGYVKQYHVHPLPEKMVTVGLGFTDIADTLERNNHSIGAGYIARNGESYVVRADGRVQTIEQLADMVVTRRNGAIIHLRDIADITVGTAFRNGSASENGVEVVVGTALMLTGGNSRTIAQAVDARMQEVNRILPPDIQAKTVLNRTTLVDSTIHTVQKNLAEGALLVIAVLFALLGNFRAACITALVIPLSMLMAAMGMVRGGISGNLMSLGALDFGLIVDGAVIITENCLRNLAQRQQQLGRTLTLNERLHEVMQASREMIRPSVFGQAIIIIVYLPLLTLGGVEGKMFEPMAMTVIFALVAAFILSLTFVPAMIALTVKGRVQEKENRLIQRGKYWYEPLLRRVLRAPMPVISSAAGGFILSLALLASMGQEFMPTLDEHNIALHAMRIPSTSLEQSQQLQQAVEKAASQLPEVAFAFSKTGTAEMAADPMPPNVSDMFVILHPRSAWPDPRKSKPQLLEELRRAVESVPGNNYEFTQPIEMRFNELISGVRSDIAIKIFGDDFAQMERYAARIATLLGTIPGATDVKAEQTSGQPMLDIRPDSEALARLGLNRSDVLNTVAIALGGRITGQMFEGDRRFDIVVRLPDARRNQLDTIGNLPILLPAREEGVQFVPLSHVADITLTDGRNQISRENGKRRVVVQANVSGRDIGSFVAEAQQTLANDIRLPAGYWLEWGGQFENLQEAKTRLSLVVPLCFFMIFLLLFSALGSVRQALVVFSGVPLALTGGILALWLRDMPFSITAAVGFIALSGVAVLNGLVMVTRINQLVREGMPTPQAIVEGALTRLRPVLMTALVASLGFVPMALATGAGAEVQKPLATVVIGGLITATALTLLVLPALYQRFHLARHLTGQHTDR